MGPFDGEREEQGFYEFPVHGIRYIRTKYEKSAGFVLKIFLPIGIMVAQRSEIPGPGLKRRLSASMS